MYITISKNLEEVQIYNGIDNHSGKLYIALCEISYSVNWVNISKKLKNNKLIEYGRPYEIPDGYYDFCGLSKTIFKPRNITAELNQANLLVTLSSEKNFQLSENLATMLGFKTNIFNIGKHTGVNPIKMTVNKSLYVHLNELNTNQNLLNGKPSTLLEIIPTNRSSYCERETKEYIAPRYKQLSKGFHESLNLTIKNKKGELVEFNDLFLVLSLIKWQEVEDRK